jgi:hypothetical protein
VVESSFTDEDEASWWERLVLLPVRDASPTPITKKILRHPTFLSQVRSQYATPPPPPILKKRLCLAALSW